jgi:hypothetical protein
MGGIFKITCEIFCNGYEKEPVNKTVSEVSQSYLNLL